MGIAVFSFLISGGLAFASDGRGADLATLKSRVKAMRLHEDPQWLLLGHYKGSAFGGYKSEVVGSAFFVSPEGRTHPEEELLATLEGLFDPADRVYEQKYGKDGKDQMAVRCQFPARARWLTAKLGVDPSNLPAVSCDRLDDYRKRLSARSVSLVFSSYYLNNPSSSFGHSFLRLNKSPSGAPESKRTELLDHGINFAAEVTTNNQLLFAVYGLLGFFRGTYSNVPYYYKVREYNDFESRDLWSYDLNLTQDELDLLVDHLWELGTSYHDYYYFTQNCSYQILTAIEAAAPRFRITEHLPPLYVIPADTVKQVVATPGLVGRISYRPSVRSQFFHRLTLLDSRERESLRQLAVERSVDRPPAEFAEDSQARVLDAAMDYMDFMNPQDLLNADTPSALWKQKLLLARARVAARSPALDIAPPLKESPHEGHDSTRLGIEAGHEKGMGGFAQVDLRFALHDLLDATPGYPVGSQIEFGNLQVRYFYSPSQLEMENFGLIRITSLSPRDEFQLSRSWRVEVAGKRIRDENCDRCFAESVELGTGYAWNLGASLPVTVYALGEVEASYSPSFLRAKLRPGVGPRAGFVFGGERFRGSVYGAYHYQAFSAFPNTAQGSAELRYGMTRSVAVNLRGAAYNTGWESSVSGFFYY